MPAIVIFSLALGVALIGAPGKATLLPMLQAAEDVLLQIAGTVARAAPLGVFALQPAPVQVAWLGYPATTGLAGIGYRLTDAEADPPGAADRLRPHATRRAVRPDQLRELRFDRCIALTERIIVGI